MDRGHWAQRVSTTCSAPIVTVWPIKSLEGVDSRCKLEEDLCHFRHEIYLSTLLFEDCLSHTLAAICQEVYASVCV